MFSEEGSEDIAEGAVISHNEAFHCAGRSADLEELSSAGYLLEANRRFFLPLGLHLCVRITGEEEEPFRLALLDHRAVPGGLYYGRSDDDPGLDAVLSARRRKAGRRLEPLWARNAALRRRECGYVRQPVEDL